MSKEYPRWVQVHESHVVRKGEKPLVSVSVPDFGERFVAPDGSVSVLVHDAEEELQAVNAKDDPVPETKKDNDAGDLAPARKPKNKDDN
jgi:hypothetical protein